MTELGAPAVPAVKVSVVIPCLNEELNIEQCIILARRVLEERGIAGEVIVADNGSDDRSAELAAAAGATVVHEPRRGYGAAYLAGFASARGDYIVMIDADLTYDFEEIPNFVRELDEGADLVMGNRMENIEPGAMSLTSRLGNPILSRFLNLVYRTPIGDVHCGLRAIRRDALPKLDLHSTGMEFASEMVIRAVRADLDIREQPITLHVRGGESKLSPLRDGWRHVRLMLVYSPGLLFLIPGAVMVCLGLLIVVTVLAKLTIFGRQFYIHAEIGGSMLVIVGVEVIVLGLIARTYGFYFMAARDPFLERMHRHFTLERGLLAGGLVLLTGFVGGLVIVGDWLAKGAGSLGQGEVALLAATVVVVGVEIFFASFVLSILGLRRPSLSSPTGTPPGERDAAAHARDREADRAEQREQSRLGGAHADVPEEQHVTPLAHAVPGDRDRQRGNE
jgi:glycosyltransferase involved in cell wall biosynthesis